MARGKDKYPVLWKPNVVDIDGPIAAHFWNLPEMPVAVSVDVLTNLDEWLPPRGKYEALQNLMIRYATAEVARRKWGANIDLKLGGKKITGVTKRQIRLEGSMLITLFELTSDTFGLLPCGYPSPAQWWSVCVMEGCWSHRRRYFLDEQPPKTKRDVISDFERKTATLRNRQNPFTWNHSKKLFDAALSIADRGTGSDKHSFYNRSFKPYLKSRADMADFLRQRGPKRVPV